MKAGTAFCTLLAGLLAAFGPPASPVQAQRKTAAILGINTNQELSPETRERIFDAVMEALAAEAVTPKSERWAQGRLRGSCTDSGCAPAARITLGVDYAVMVALWRHDRKQELVVALTDRTGLSYPGTAAIDPYSDDFGDAASEAVHNALAKSAIGPGPWLLLVGSPAHATARLDGERLGTLPLRRRVDPGLHDLEVTADGHRPHRRVIEVPREPLSTTRIAVRLEPKEGVATPALAGHGSSKPSNNSVDEGPRVAGRSTLNTAGPIALGVTGSAALLVALLGRTAGTDCLERDPSGVCLRQREPSTAGVALWSGLGAASLIGALIWYIVGTPEERPSIGATTSGAGLTVDF